MSARPLRRRLPELEAEIRACRACPNLGGGIPGSGSERPSVVFVGEAPGRFGCGRTGVPFVGDRSAGNFARLLAAAGLTREEVFVTNAVHCLALSADGRNRRPSAREAAECRRFLLSEVAVLRPRIVATLGAVALAAVTGKPQGRTTLRREVGRPRRAGNFTVFPLFHPSPLVTATARPLEEQERDFARLGRWLRRRARKRSALLPGDRE